MTRRFLNLKPLTREQMKDSGMAAVLVLILIGLLAGENIWFIAAALALLINMLFPAFFYPFALVWFGLSTLIGHLSSKILLFLVFLLVVIPVALARQLAGKDPLLLKQFKKDRTSVMKTRNHLYTASDLDKPF